MRRRDFLAGLGGAAVVGVGGYVALSSPRGTVQPVEVDLFDAPGSPGDTLGVPISGEITVLDLFATTCPPCKPALDALAAVRPVEDDVQFVSVTSEYLDEGASGATDDESTDSEASHTRSDVIDWWATHGGQWPVGYDAQGVLMRRLDVGALPHTAVIDADGTVSWTHTGVPDPENIRDAIDRARR